MSTTTDFPPPLELLPYMYCSFLHQLHSLSSFVHTNLTFFSSSVNGYPAKMSFDCRIVKVMQPFVEKQLCSCRSWCAFTCASSAPWTGSGWLWGIHSPPGFNIFDTHGWHSTQTPYYKYHGWPRLGQACVSFVSQVVRKSIMGPYDQFREFEPRIRLAVPRNEGPLFYLLQRKHAIYPELEESLWFGGSILLSGSLIEGMAGAIVIPTMNMVSPTVMATVVSLAERRGWNFRFYQAFVSHLSESSPRGSMNRRFRRAPTKSQKIQNLIYLRFESVLLKQGGVSWMNKYTILTSSERMKSPWESGDHTEVMK